jgi:flagellar basal body-associated protein FliL
MQAMSAQEAAAAVAVEHPLRRVLTLVALVVLVVCMVAAVVAAVALPTHQATAAMDHRAQSSLPIRQPTETWANSS